MLYNWLCIYISWGAISWTSKHQPSIALSTTEAKYISMMQASKEAIWLMILLKELKKGGSEMMVINVDNQGSMHLAKNLEYHTRTKHIKIQHHFIQEAIKMKKVELVYCPMNDID